MARQHPDDVQKEVEELEDEVYGDQTVSGTNPAPTSDDDTKENLEDVIGNEPDQAFNIGDEINSDEHAIQDLPINDYQEEEQDEEEEVVEEEAEVVDPMERVSDEDVE